MYCFIIEEMNNMVDSIIKIKLTAPYQSVVRDVNDEIPVSLKDLMMEDVPDYGLYLPL
jgi:hypothetical protein